MLRKSRRVLRSRARGGQADRSAIRLGRKLRWSRSRRLRGSGSFQKSQADIPTCAPNGEGKGRRERSGISCLPFSAPGKTPRGWPSRPPNRVPTRGGEKGRHRLGSARSWLLRSSAPPSLSRLRHMATRLERDATGSATARLTQYPSGRMCLQARTLHQLRLRAGHEFGEELAAVSELLRPAGVGSGVGRRQRSRSVPRPLVALDCPDPEDSPRLQRFAGDHGKPGEA